MTFTPEQLDEAAGRLIGWAFSDSLVHIDGDALCETLKADADQCGYLMNDEQAQLFICGNDDGEIPAQLVRDFPKTHAFVGGHW